MAIAAPSRRPPNGLRSSALQLATEVRAESIPAGIPFYDTLRDAQVRALPGFPDFVRRLSRVRRLTPLYGAKEHDRLALAFAYGARRFSTPADAWRALWPDVIRPTLKFFGIANLQNFSAEDDVIEFDDGLTIRVRDYTALTILTGWDSDQLEATLGDDWRRGFGFGTHVLIATEDVQKTPETLVLVGSGTEWPRLRRLLLAMQLVAPGDVRTGRLYFGRREVIPLTGGISSTARSASGPGAPYRLPSERVAEVKELYERLQDFDLHHRERLGNIAIALDRFAGTFDRPWGTPHDYVIDDIIALEAIVGTKDELAFTIAFRVSGMLEADDKVRLALFRTLRSFYRTRSDLVHGTKLNQRASLDLGRETELRDVVRRLLRGLLPLIGSKYEPTPAFFKDRLDEILLDPTERASLAVALRP